MSHLTISMSYGPTMSPELDAWMDSRRDPPSKRDTSMIREKLVTIVTEKSNLVIQALSKDFELDLYSAKKLYDFFLVRLSFWSTQVLVTQSIFELESKSDQGNSNNVLVVDTNFDLFHLMGNLALLLNIDHHLKVLVMNPDPPTGSLVTLQVLAHLANFDLNTVDNNVDECLKNIEDKAIVLTDRASTWRTRLAYNTNTVAFINCSGKYVAVVQEESDLDSAVDTLLSASRFSGVQVLLQESISDAFLAKVRSRMKNEQNVSKMNTDFNEYCKRVVEVGGDVYKESSLALITDLNVASDIDLRMPRCILNTWPFRTLKEALGIVNKKIVDVEYVSIFTDNVAVANELALNLQEPKHVWVNAAHQYRARAGPCLQNLLALKSLGAMKSTGNSKSQVPTSALKPTLNELRGITKAQRVTKLIDWVIKMDVKKATKTFIMSLVSNMDKDGSCLMDNKEYVLYTMNRKVDDLVIVYCNEDVEIDFVMALVIVNLALGSLPTVVVDNLDLKNELDVLLNSLPWQVIITTEMAKCDDVDKVWLLTNRMDGVDKSFVTEKMADKLVVCLNTQTAIQESIERCLKDNEKLVWMPKATIFAN